MAHRLPIYDLLLRLFILFIELPAANRFTAITYTSGKKSGPSTFSAMRWRLMNFTKLLVRRNFSFLLIKQTNVTMNPYLPRLRASLSGRISKRRLPTVTNDHDRLRFYLFECLELVDILPTYRKSSCCRSRPFDLIILLAR